LTLKSYNGGNDKKLKKGGLDEILTIKKIYLL